MYFRHFVKGIKNKLFKASKLKTCIVLKEWLSSIVNMLWWALDTAQGICTMHLNKSQPMYVVCVLKMNNSC